MKKRRGENLKRGETMREIGLVLRGPVEHHDEGPLSIGCNIE